MFEQGALAQQREGAALDQRVFTPADCAIRRALAQTVVVAECGDTCGIPPSTPGSSGAVLRGGEGVRLSTPCLGALQTGHHLKQAAYPDPCQPMTGGIRYTFHPL